MARVVVAGFFSRKLRAILTGVSIALGVSLMSGTYILTDTINNTFAGIFSTAYKNTDVSITPHPAIGRHATVGTASIPESTLARVQAVPGVAKAAGGIFTPVSLLDANGKRLGQHSFSFAAAHEPPPFQTFIPTSGRFAATANEVAIDESTASTYNLKLGDSIIVAGAAPAHRYTIVGFLTFGGSNSAGGGAAVLTLPEAQRVALEPNAFDAISVAAAPGITPTELSRRIRAVLPATLDVRTGAQQATQRTSDLEKQLAPLRTFLLVFAYVALFVGAFIIFNTFAITVTQRTREFGLLRTLGATRGQLLRSVLAEGVLLGLIGSGIGLLAGLAIAPGLDALFKNVFGASLPATGTVVKGRTIWVSLLAGTAVTVLSALTPAIRATRVPPVAALREGSPREYLARPPLSTAQRTWRLGVAALLLILGVTRLISGNYLLGGIEVAIGVIYGVRVWRGGRLGWVSPVVARLGRALGALVAWRGVIGRLARDNAIRQPGRTAVTAAALMIGLALVTFAAILAAGLKTSINQAVDSSFAGNLIVENAQTNSDAGIPISTAPAVATVPGVQSVTPLAFTLGKVGGVAGDSQVTAIDPTEFGRVYRVDWVKGSNATLATLGNDGTVLTNTFADSNHLHVGQRLAVRTPTGARLSLTVRGIAKDNARLLTDLTVSLALARTAFAQRTDALVFVTYAPGAANAEVQPAVDRLLAAHYPQTQSRTAEQFKAEEAGQVNSLLTFVYILLTLSIVVSLFGIVNTLVLSIYERRRELGLLRAVGTSRRQVRELIRYESVVTALIGGVLGIVLGIIIALVSSASLSSQGFVLTFPVGTLIILLVLAGLAGVLAAIWPARRAAKVDVLEALATE
jgi:putative ABC transport system permease protein